MRPAEVLNEVAQQVSACERCALHFSRKNSVPGEGPPNVEMILIGEGPGFFENEQGRPFVGNAGMFLDELLQKAGVSRKEVFITNVVKCRPPGNRDPLPEELAACGDYLDRQIEALDPKVIVTLGRFSMARYLPNAHISEIHGQARWVRGRLVVAMFHPAAALHQPSLKTAIEADFTRLPEIIRQARPEARQPGEAPAGQTGESRSNRTAAAAKPGAPAQPDLLSGWGRPDVSGAEDSEGVSHPDSNRPDPEPPFQMSLF